jgi:hypothetical protein
VILSRARARAEQPRSSGPQGLAVLDPPRGCLSDDRLAGRRPAPPGAHEHWKENFFWTVLAVLTRKIVGDKFVACKMSQ